jgi:hypothetical protein
MMEVAFMGNCSGLGRTGMDFWAVLDRSSLRPGIKHSTTVNARYPETCWDQLNMDRATEALLAPGPDGAISTERFEALREGIQEAEGRAFLEGILTDPARRAKLGEASAKHCQEVLDERAWHFRAACLGGWNWFEGAGSAGLSEKLFSAAAEAAKALGKK